MNSSDFKRVKLKDITNKITKGTTPTTIGRKFTNEGVNYYKAQCITSNKYLDKSYQVYIDEETQKKLIRSQLEENDILFSMAGIFLGKTCIVRKEDVPANINQAVALIRVNNELVDVNYLYYFLSQSKVVTLVNNITSQSAQPNINLKQIGDLTIKLPCFKEQPQIAKILSDLDEKIEINNKINDNLEKIAEAIFKQWFIDFEFPNENGEPYKSSGGEMIERELGEIPKGWEVKELQEITSNITRGQTPKYEEYSKIKVLNQKVNKGKVLEKQYFKYLKDDIEISKEKYACQWDILVNSLGQGTLGRVHLYKEKTNDIVIDQHITIIRTESKGLAFYLYALLDSSKYKGVLEGLISGSTGMLMLNISKIRGLKVIKPSERVLLNFENILINLYENINNNNIQNETLIKLRDSLLPKLMSGEIRVPLEEN